MSKNPAAVALGKLGGSAKSERKTQAARENAKKPRPNRPRIAELTVRLATAVGTAEMRDIELAAAVVRAEKAEAIITTLRSALEAVLLDAAIEDDYESIDSDGRFISKPTLLTVRAVMGRKPQSQ